jgi:hypothetical protein
VDLAPAAETPLLSINSSENDAACRRFYKALLDSGRAVLAEFEWGGGRIIPVTASETFPNAVRLDVRRNRSLLAFRYAEALKLVTQGGMGEFNRGLGWRGDDLVDEADRYEVTIRPAGRAPPSADVTLRRLQKFHVEGGKLYHWTNRGADGKTVLQEGDVTIGPDGLLTVRDFKVVAGGSRLIVVPR